MKRLLNPLTNPAGYTAFTAALYAVIRAVTDKGGAGSDPQVWLTAGMAVVSFVTRFYVTPVRDPKDGAGNPLKAAPVITGNLTAEIVRNPSGDLTFKLPAQPPAGTTP